MASSLDSLVKNIQKHENLEKHCSGNVLLRKGVYPYDYMDSLAKLDETSLPPKNAFYSKLNDSNISDDDYKHAQSVWNIFKMKSMRDYHDIYLKTDVLHLADVFENFRDVCLQNYILDPAWYYTAPGLAWDAALKITGVELELLSDPDMLLFIEKGIRGGISMISHRYGKANNKYMDYDKDKPTKHLTYLDANNLYGWAMNKPLPTHGFEWMNENELDSWKDHSCILEVDLDYPNKLHDLHNDYPLAPESVKVNKVAKLIPNLNNKTKYIIHYENLKLYESLGMKIIKVHRGIKFQESPWLKKYIDLNTNLRSKATNDFEKDFFKLMNNSVFGKTMENIRNRVDIQLVNNEKKARKLAAKPNFKHCNIFDENLIAMHMKKTKLVFNKPVYLGLCILDLSKTLMYDFHYNYIKKKYGEKAKLLFTDTDSLAYEIETEDFYKDISNDVSKIFDTSNFPKDHPSGIETGVNKKVVGMFKDEAGGKIIDQFVGLRAKLYSYKMFEGVEEKKCKGIKRSVVKKNIDFEDYKRCLFDQKDQNRKMNVIRSYGHNLYTEEVNKIALSANDDKRVILDDGIHTLAYGHYKLSASKLKIPNFRGVYLRDTLPKRSKKKECGNIKSGLIHLEVEHIGVFTCTDTIQYRANTTQRSSFLWSSMSLHFETNKKWIARNNKYFTLKMPVDKFGRMTKTKVDDVVTLSHINNNFLRRDGTNTTTGTINMIGRSVYETDAASLSDIHEKIAEETIFTKQLIDKKSLDVLTEARNLIKNYALLRNGTSKPHTNIDWNMKKIINLGDPDDLNDATTRGYVDNLITQKIRSETLLLDGPKKDINWNDKKITNLGNPINEQDAVNKNYVDRISQASTHLINEKALLVDGTNVPMNDINWNRKKITNLANPENASDAVNKHYVDHVQKKPIITIWAEENSGTTDGEYEWSFGNGGDGSDHGLQGYCMPASGRIPERNYICSGRYKARRIHASECCKESD
ncbi:hypothetical protein GQR58_026696 [Nymphon striatum]|nr:hypothetical protein GQR58_026696 [Nymphon striatum]KAG1651865.1 hypothetical protein GQR58_026696 [Nymphon striatum]